MTVTAPASLPQLRGWLERYQAAVAYLATSLTSTEGRKRSIGDRDHYGALVLDAGMGQALEQADALSSALTRSQVVLTAALELAERQGQPADLLAYIRSVINQNDVALRGATGL